MAPDILTISFDADMQTYGYRDRRREIGQVVAETVRVKKRGRERDRQTERQTETETKPEAGTDKQAEGDGGVGEMVREE